jgi:AcrR family transcriptional regulator
VTHAYDSKLRRELAEQTRERILEAFADELAEAGEAFSIPRVAKRAGVATRTVYHHFPNREIQIEELAKWIEKRVGGETELPRSIDDLERYTRNRVERFFAHEHLFRAQLTTGIASTVRARRRREREAAFEACIAKAGLRGEQAKVTGALIKHLVSAKFGVPLADDYGLSPEQMVAVQSWVVGVVAAAIERGELPTPEE